MRWYTSGRTWKLGEMFRYHYIPKYVACRYCSIGTKAFHEIPSPRGLPFIGTLFSLITAGGANNLHHYIDKRHREFGSIFRENLGPITSVFLNDAEEMRKIFMYEGRYPKHVLPECWLLYNKVKNYQRGLYFMDGDEWFKNRKFLNDILLRRDYYPKAAQNVVFVQDVFERWLQCCNGGQIFDLEIELYNLSLIFMMSFVFGSRFHENVDVFLPRIRRLSRIVKDIFQCSVKLSIVPATLAMRLNLKIWTDFGNAVDESVRITQDLLNDAVSISCENKVSDSEKGILHFLLDQKLERNLIERVVVDFIIAAGDTNAYTTLWTFYLLGRHKGAQRELFVDVTRSHENSRRHRALSVWNVIRESMRMYPIAPFIARYLPEETSICSYRIPPNQLISLSMYNCSQNDKYFPNADQFLPSRWQRLASGKYVGVTDPYATLPFAAGTRSCIGRNLSKAQLFFIINKIVSLYEIESLNEVNVKLNLITVPSEPIHLRLKKR